MFMKSTLFGRNLGSIQKLENIVRKLKWDLRYYLLDAKLRNIIKEVIDRKLTYLRKSKLIALAALAKAHENNHIPGIIIEAGCALGGSSIVLAAAKNRKRKFMIYDVFDVIPAPSHKDGYDAHNRYETIVSGNSEGLDGDVYYGYQANLYSKVKSNLCYFKYNPEENTIDLIKGLVQDTLEVNQSVSLAHIDVDWYEPVMVCLERIVPKLSLGGCIVIDEYFSESRYCLKYKFDPSAGSLVITRIM